MPPHLWRHQDTSNVRPVLSLVWEDPDQRRCWDHVTPYAASGVQIVYLFNIYFYLFIWLHQLLEKAMAAHCSTLAWKIPQRRSLVGCSPWGCYSRTRLSDFTFTFHFHALVNAEFQRIARRDKKTFFSDQCKEIEENNRMGKTRESLQENQRYQRNISCKDGLDKGQKWYGPNRSRRY